MPGGLEIDIGLARLLELCSWFQKSREIYQVFLDAGKVTAVDAARLAAVTEGMASATLSPG